MKNQIRKAKLALSKTAKNSPWLFPIYGEYQQALRDFELNKIKIKDLKKKWEQIIYP